MSIYRLETCHKCGDHHSSSAGRWQYRHDATITWQCDNCTATIATTNIPAEILRDRLLLGYSPDTLPSPPNRKG